MKKAKMVHSNSCEWNIGHDCNCIMAETHADNCEWHLGHDCDCTFGKKFLKKVIDYYGK